MDIEVIRIELSAIREHIKQLKIQLAMEKGK